MKLLRKRKCDSEFQLIDTLPITGQSATSEFWLIHYTYPQFEYCKKPGTLFFHKTTEEITILLEPYIGYFQRCKELGTHHEL